LWISRKTGDWLRHIVDDDRVDETGKENVDATKSSVVEDRLY